MSNVKRLTGWVCCLAAGGLWLAAARADDPAADPPGFKHRVTGLFCLERQDDLRKVVEMLPGIKLVAIDYKNGEATFQYDADVVFNKANPEQIVERFDNMLRQASNHTFGVRPRSTVPPEKLQSVEIGVLGLDCKACGLAAYESIYKLDGVEQATASFRDGLVTARIDPEKTNRATLEKALQSRNVTLKTPPAEK